MSPKDAIGHDPEFGDPMYKHIPFYIRINEKQPMPSAYFIIIPTTAYLIWGKRFPAIRIGIAITRLMGRY